MWFESGLEENWATVLIARPDVGEVREQQLVRYRDGGQYRKHFFDFVVTWTDGSRTAYAVKYEADVEKKPLRHILQLIADSNGDDFADEYSILTEKHVDEVTIANARLVLSCSSDFDDEGRWIVRAHLAGCGTTVRLGDIGRLTRLGERGYRAAVSLVHDGILEAAPGNLLGRDTSLRNHAASNACVNPILTATD